MKTLVLFILLLIPINGLCDNDVSSVRYNHRIIRLDDPKLKVIKNFGYPIYEEVLRLDYSIITQWSYIKNSNNYIIIVFKHGKVIRIKTGRL